MNEKQLLIEREYNLTEGRVNWYSAEQMFDNYPSVELSGYYDTTSSAGDWGGYIVQKIKNMRYLIFFYQSNNWPRYGYTVTTTKVIASWKGELSKDDVLQIIDDVINS